MATHLDRAILLAQMKRYAEAEQELRALLSQNPNHAVAHALLGIALLRLGKQQAALDEVETAIGLDPTCSYAFYAQAVVLIGAKQVHAARRAVREAIRLNPHDPDYFVLLGAMFFDLGRWQRALEELDRGLALAPQHVRCLNLRGRVLQQLGRTDEARQAFDAALASSPENADAHYARGNLALAAYDDVALDHLLEARRLDPTSKNDYNAIALAFGRRLPPFRWIAPFILRWYAWRPKRTCVFFLGLLLAYILLNLGLTNLRGDPSRAGILLAMAAANVVLAPPTFDSWAAGMAKLFRRRLVGAPWHALLVALPRLAWPLFCQLFLSAMMVLQPVAIFVFSGLACTDFVKCLFSDHIVSNMKVGLRTVYALLLICSSMAVLITLESNSRDWLLCYGVFGVLAFFSDNAARFLRRWEP